MDNIKEKSMRDLTRTLNGQNQRIEAAFLLLSICPVCGANCRVNTISKKGWDLWCPKHSIVSSRSKLELWEALDPASGALTE